MIAHLEPTNPALADEMRRVHGQLTVRPRVRAVRDGASLDVEVSDDARRGR